MAIEGTVRVWLEDEGWGVIDTDQTPGGCWTHFSSVHTAGYRTLSAGQKVMVDWEVGGQDGYAFRAVRAWPAGEQPVDQMVTPGGAHGSAYSSSLTLAWDNGTTLLTQPPERRPDVEAEQPAPLIQLDDASIYLHSLRAWREGFAFAITAKLTAGAALGDYWPHLLVEGRRAESGSIWELGGAFFPLTVVMDNGPSLAVKNADHESPFAGGVFSLTGEGLFDTWTEQYWVAPLPMSGPIEFTIDWQDLGPSGSTVIDSASLHA